MTRCVLCGGSGREIAQVVTQRRLAALVNPKAEVKPRYWGFMGKVRFAIETIVNRVA
jgi:hypothetical protein